jgi:hypothetical protein
MAALSLWGLTLAFGCATIDKNMPTMLSTASGPHRVDVVWSKHVEQIPDPTRNGAPSPAVTGHLYVFSNDKSGKPIAAEGKLTIELFDDGAAGNGPGTKLLEQTIFPPDVLARLKTQDQLGIGYSIGVPCPAAAQRVHLAARFEPAGAGQPLSSISEVITLDRGAAREISGAATR